jgi:hydrogenase maturation protease
MVSLLSEYAARGSLVVGIGNVGREDDGLGWAFVDWLETTGECAGTELVRAYQLQLEDADLVSRVDRVLFVDSTTDPDVATYQLSIPEPRLEVAFTSHALTIPTVLEISRQCFSRLPDVRLLAIRGHSFTLTEGLTPLAADHLAVAIAALSSDQPRAVPVPTPV